MGAFRTLVVAGVLVVAVGSVAGPAAAGPAIGGPSPKAKVDVIGGRLAVTAANGVNDDIVLTSVGDGAVLVDATGLLDVRRGCTPDAIDPSRATCTGVRIVDLDLRDGDDYAESRVVDLTVQIAAGAGNDIVVGGPSHDRITGGRGSDLIKTYGDGFDLVDCGSDGQDVAQTDAGDKTMQCELVAHLPV